MNNSTPLLLSTEKQLEFDDMQRHILILITCLLAVVAPAQNKVQKSVPTIYVEDGFLLFVDRPGSQWQQEQQAESGKHPKGTACNEQRRQSQQQKMRKGEAGSG